MSVGSAIFQDAQTLKVTMRYAISTSPNSFLITLRDVASKEADDWIHEIKSSTWVVAERDGEGVGVAACKPHSRARTKSPTKARVTSSRCGFILVSAGAG
jgi:hypothetical protein